MDVRAFVTWKLVAVCAAAALVPTASVAAGGRAAAPACTTSGLVVWLNTSGSGAAGSTYYELELTNLSGGPCSLLGYPGVSAIDLHGHQLGSAAARDRSAAPRLVLLANGATAKAVLQIGEAANFSPSACHRVTAAGLRVYPPGQTAAKLVPFPFDACSRAGPVYLTVRPVS